MALEAGGVGRVVVVLDEREDETISIALYHERKRDN